MLTERVQSSRHRAIILKSQHSDFKEMKDVSELWQINRDGRERRKP
jgi:hypothetical protein